MPQITSNVKQTKNCNCGAFGLAAICEAFGLLPAESDVFLHHRGRSATLASNLALPDAADELYKITGDLKLTGEHATEGEYYNSPSAIAHVAKKLGLHVILNAPKNGLNELITFTDELEYCAEVVNLVSDNKGVYDLPGQMECQLVVVSSTNSLHWLAVDSDGHIYDPATGRTHSDWSCLNCYTRLPFWLSFSREA